MIWSISSFKQFLRCERKWFLSEKLGPRRNKDPFRNQIHLLSELESVEAWRGKIVDYTISEFVIPKIRKKLLIKEDDVFEYARKLTRARYEFAKAERYKQEGLKKTSHAYDYSALYDIEYPDTSSNFHEKLKRSWTEIETSLRHFLTNSELIDYLKTSNYLVTQRALSYSLHGFTVKGVPDLIAFFPNQPPHIFDWKVHFFGTKTYNEQLLIYALALINCNPHKDFTEYLNGFSVFDVKLSEFQLLKNSLRNYSINDDYIEVINDYIAEGIEKMQLKKCDSEYKELNIENFEKTPNLDNCLSCQFKKICKEE
ncbi:MAG TPA: PD-(D/E)XK nuclease family protein [Chitinophagaceae bacterium]|nr:PD-(D/E)XK nuclease family protein [Chitinophagaceae bacterium]